MEKLDGNPDVADQFVESCCAASGGWRLPLLLCVVLAGLLLYGKNQPVIEQPQDSSELGTWLPTPPPEGQTVGLTIDFGNGAKRNFDALPWREGMTLDDLMQMAKQFRPGIRFEQQGTGEMAFLTSLEGLANQGGGGNFWQFQINGIHGQQSFGSQRLAVGDRVLWTFGLPE